MPNLALQSLLAGKAAALPGAAATSTPAPVVPGAAAAAAAVVPQVTLPNAGTPQQNLLQLVTEFAARNGTTPKVNPPESTKVLTTETLAEAGGAPQPDETDKGPAVEPPTSKPADVLAAEAAKRTRRTAAVVQEELDLANVEIATLKQQLAAKSSSKQEDLDYIEQLRGEAKLREEDATKLFQRNEELTAALEAAEAMNAQAVEVITQLQAGAASAPVQVPAGGLSDLPTIVLSQALAAQGFTVKLEVPAA
jgi:hypothetical protein